MGVQAARSEEYPALEIFRRLGHGLDDIPRPIDDEGFVDYGAFGMLQRFAEVSGIERSEDKAEKLTVFSPERPGQGDGVYPGYPRHRGTGDKEPRIVGRRIAMELEVFPVGDDDPDAGIHPGANDAARGVHADQAQDFRDLLDAFTELRLDGGLRFFENGAVGFHIMLEYEIDILDAALDEFHPLVDALLEYASCRGYGIPVLAGDHHPDPGEGYGQHYADDDEGGRPSSGFVYPGGHVRELSSLAAPEGHLSAPMGTLCQFPSFMSQLL